MDTYQQRAKHNTPKYHEDNSIQNRQLSGGGVRAGGAYFICILMSLDTDTINTLGLRSETKATLKQTYATFKQITFNTFNYFRVGVELE